MTEYKPQDPIRLKIISDGTREGTKIINTVTNEVMANVMTVEWSMSAEGSCEARVTLVIPKAQIEVEGDYFGLISGQVDGVLFPVFDKLREKI